jgi:hypothetical protein
MLKRVARRLHVLRDAVGYLLPSLAAVLAKWSRDVVEHEHTVHEELARAAGQAPEPTVSVPVRVFTSSRLFVAYEWRISPGSVSLLTPDAGGRGSRGG